MDEDKCVGAIVCKLDLHKKMVRRGYIAMLAVDENYRRRGIGKCFKFPLTLKHDECKWSSRLATCLPNGPPTTPPPLNQYFDNPRCPIWPKSLVRVIDITRSNPSLLIKYNLKCQNWSGLVVFTPILSHTITNHPSPPHHHYHPPHPWSLSEALSTHSVYNMKAIGLMALLSAGQSS